MSAQKVQKRIKFWEEKFWKCKCKTNEVQNWKTISLISQIPSYLLDFFCTHQLINKIKKEKTQIYKTRCQREKVIIHCITIKKHSIGLDKWGNISCLWIKWLNNKKMSVLPKFIYKFNIIPIKTPTNLFMELDRLIPKFTWKNKYVRISRKTLEKVNYDRQ